MTQGEVPSRRPHSVAVGRRPPFPTRWASASKCPLQGAQRAGRTAVPCTRVSREHPPLWVVCASSQASGAAQGRGRGLRLHPQGQQDPRICAGILKPLHPLSLKLAERPRQPLLVRKVRTAKFLLSLTPWKYRTHHPRPWTAFAERRRVGVCAEPTGRRHRAGSSEEGGRGRGRLLAVAVVEALACFHRVLPQRLRGRQSQRGTGVLGSLPTTASAPCCVLLIVCSGSCVPRGPEWRAGPRVRSS